MDEFTEEEMLRVERALSNLVFPENKGPEPASAELYAEVCKAAGKELA